MQNQISRTIFLSGARQYARASIHSCANTPSRIIEPAAVNDRDELSLVRAKYVLDENQLDPQGLPTPEYILIQPKKSLSVDPASSPLAQEDSGGQPRLDVSGPVSEQHWNKASSIEEVLRTASLKDWPEAASALHDPKR